MSKSFEDVLRQSARELLIDTTVKPCRFIELESDEIVALSERILLLPQRYIEVLIFTHLYHFDNEATASILEEKDVAGLRTAALKILAYIMKLPEGAMFDNQSMDEAVKMASEEYVNETIKDIPSIQPKYSSKFRKSLKEIKAAQKPAKIWQVALKRVAVFLVVAIIGFTGTIAVNADLRDTFFRWVIKTFPQFSEFSAADTTMPLTEENFELLKTYEAEYIPERFELMSKYDAFPKMFYSYANDDKIITIMGQIPSENGVLYDTEDAEIEEIIYKGNIAYYWQHNDATSLMWNQDGFMFTVMSNLSEDEVFKIADSIIKK